MRKKELLVKYILGILSTKERQLLDYSAPFKKQLTAIHRCLSGLSVFF